MPFDPEGCGDLGLAIARDGSWYYRGSRIDRLPLVKLFASVLRRGDDDDDYWLITPVERGRLAVEDVPFVVVEMAIDGIGQAQTIRLRSNLDEWVTVSAERPLFVRPQPDGHSAPYVMMRPELEARLVRSVYYELVEHGEERGGGFGVWSSGDFFTLGSLEDR